MRIESTLPVHPTMTLQTLNHSRLTILAVAVMAQIAGAAAAIETNVTCEPFYVTEKDLSLPALTLIFFSACTCISCFVGAIYASLLEVASNRGHMRIPPGG